MIFPTANISFPRSGHHALKAVLEGYFGDELRYCDNYFCDPLDKLGVNPKTNYQKEHDLNLEYPTNLEDARYLIQLRNPLFAIQSWIDFDARSLDSLKIQTQEEWRQSFQSKLDFWYSWFSKWILSPIPHRLVVPYLELVSSPYRTCESVIQFMTGQHPDPFRLKRSLDSFPIVSRPNRYSSFIGAV